MEFKGTKGYWSLHVMPDTTIEIVCEGDIIADVGLYRQQVDSSEIYANAKLFLYSRELLSIAKEYAEMAACNPERFDTKGHELAKRANELINKIEE